MFVYRDVHMCSCYQSASGLRLKIKGCIIRSAVILLLGSKAKLWDHLPIKPKPAVMLSWEHLTEPLVH